MNREPGRELSAVDSVLLSVGPVCAKRHHGVTQAELIARQRAANAAELVAA